MKEKIEGFEWFVHQAFKNSVAQCKFEEGAIIYRHPPKGNNWGKEIQHIEYFIQIKSPSRSSINNANDLNGFHKNWNSKVIFQKIYPNEPHKNKEIITSQGKLFTFLWKNLDYCLDDKTIIPPVINSIPTKCIDYYCIKNDIPLNHCAFVIITDSVNNLLISKRRLIHESLLNNFEIYTKRYETEKVINKYELNLWEDNEISPTIGVESFIINSQNIEEIHETLKKVLFKGEKDKFNINVHGLLIQK